MSQTLVKSGSAGALAATLAMTSAFSVAEPPSSAANGEFSGYRMSESAARSSAYSDLLANLRDHFLFDDFSSIETWLDAHPELYGSLFVASEQADRVFGRGRSKWLTVLEDWEGVSALSLEVEFGGSGEDASNLCRRFVSDWLVHQDVQVRRSLDVGVRYV
jgi:hypothetical protein